MRRFVLGFVLGVVVSVAVAAAAWPTSPDAVHERLPPPRTAGDPADGVPLRGTEDGRDDSATRPARRHTPTQPTSTSAESDAPGDEPPITALRETLRLRQWARLRDEVRNLRRVHPLMVIPRELVVAIWTQGVVDAKDAFAHEAARTALRSWREHVLVAELTGIVNGDPAFTALADLTDELTASLAERPHAVHDLMRLLTASNDPGLRRPGLHLAATGTLPQIDVLAMAARTDPDSEVREAALIHLINRSVYDDPASRTAVGALAVELFEEPDSSHHLRGIAMSGLPHGGARGLDIAQRLVVAGGLEKRIRRTLVDALIATGRMPALLDAAAGSRELRVHLCESVFTSDEARLADVLALWPYVPSVIDAPGEEWTDSIAYTLNELDREDLIEELVRNEQLSDSTRYWALYELADSEGDPRRALQLARVLLHDRNSATTLRRDLVEIVESVAGVDEEFVAEAGALLADLATDDRNEWVRADAENAAARVAAEADTQR